MAYLDNSATTRPCQAAVDAMVRCMNDGFYNPSSVYRPAVDAFRAVRDARETLLGAVHAGSTCNLIFTSGGTEANNLAILGSAVTLRDRRVVAVTAVEHPSVREAYEKLRAEGFDVRVIGVNGRGELDWTALECALDDGAALVSCMQVNNETGALLDCERLYRTVAGRARIHVDGVQGFLRVPFDMKYADLYTISGHKIHGPKGIGALIVKKGVRLTPRQIGGGQESGMRSGTENTPGIAGFAAAAREMLNGNSEMRAELMQKKLHLIQAFQEAVPEAAINGPDPQNAAPHIVNMRFPGVRGEVMLHALEAENVYASTGSACSSKKLKVSGVLTAMGIPGTEAECSLRFSLSPHTTYEEIDEAAAALKKCYALLKGYKRR